VKTKGGTSFVLVFCLGLPACSSAKVDPAEKEWGRSTKIYASANRRDLQKSISYCREESIKEAAIPNEEYPPDEERWLLNRRKAAFDWCMRTLGWEKIVEDPVE